MTLMAPKDENELQHMLYTALNIEGPTALRYPRGFGENIQLDSELELLPVGRGELLREGDDILLLPIGNRVHPALRAAGGLEKLGIQAAVINPRFIKPLDKDLICDWAARTGRVITIEDNVRQGGFGSSVLELLSRCGLSGVSTSLLAHPDRFIEQGPQKTLWRNSSINSVSITEAAMRLIKQ
jgi:1-deoxy-D-xylulose-5-phosphate synthase